MLRLFSLRRPIRLRLLLLAVIAGCSVLVAPLLSASAQPAKPAATPAAAVPYRTTTVLVGSAQLIGALYEPTAPNPHQSTALFLTHENNNFIGSVPCVQLAQRGYTVLCVKTQYDDQAAADWDQIALDVSGSVTYLRGLHTVKKVVLVGWSGGGAIMSYYQNVAEHGVGVCQAAARLDPCSDDLAGMPPADGVVLLDAIPGIAFDRLIALDASVTDEQNLKVRNESLDMYSSANGYDPNGSSAYSQTFVNRYLTAQAKRQDGLVADALKLRKQIANGTGQYSDDAPMPVGRDYAQLWQADSNLISHTKGKYSVISPQHPTGGAPQVVKSLRVPSASSTQNDSWADAGGAYTANTYMSTTAIRAPKLRVTDDSITGVDWTSTNTATVDNVKGITTPLLIMSMTGHYFLVPAEMYYDSATHTTNKTLEFVEGATHGFTPCTACATTPGQFGDTVAETFDNVSSWLDHNYGS